MLIELNNVVVLDKENQIMLKEEVEGRRISYIDTTNIENILPTVNNLWEINTLAKSRFILGVDSTNRDKIISNSTLVEVVGVSVKYEDTYHKSYRISKVGEYKLYIEPKHIKLISQSSIEDIWHVESVKSSYRVDTASKDLLLWYIGYK